ncbi:MAG: ATP-binding protein [Candidatus Faecivicinus sp.]
MKREPRHSFHALLLTYLLTILIMSGLLTGTSYMVMFFLGFLPGILLSHVASPIGIILMVIVFAMMISMQVGRSKFKPIDDLTRAMSKVSQGDFSVRVDEEDAQGDMGVLVHSFNDMAKELGSIEMFRKDFINNFSHEFKTPIVSIRGFAKQLERDDLTPEQRREYTSIIVSESERLANMSSNILLLTKLENQQIVTDKVEYSLDEQLRSCILLLEKQWSAKEIELSLNLEETRYVGNEEMMSHIWVNLIGNAIKFSPQGALLEISCSRSRDAVVAVIRDHGEGMSEDTQKRIFEKFYQGDSAHATAGNGLGLSLVKRIVDLCGGTVTVQSRLGEGSAFTVTLPDAPAARN